MGNLYICSEFFAGLLPFASSVINALPAEGNCAIFVCTPQCDYRKTITWPAANCIFIDFPRHKVQQLGFRLYPRPLLKAISTLCRSHQVKLIHLLTEDTSLAMYLPWLKRKSPVLYTVHDLFPHPAIYKNVFAQLATYLLGKKRVNYLIKHTDNLITSSLAQYDWLVKNFPTKQIFFHNFPTLLTKSIAEGTVAVPELINVPEYILFFGRIEQYKGLEILYEAYLQHEPLRQRTLVIAGSGHIYFERQPEQEQNVIFINRYIEDGEIKSLFAKAACIVFPYTSATQSGVLSLAFYFRVPAVVSTVPFLQELIEENVTGFSFDVQTPDTLGPKLIEIQNLDLRSVAAAGYEHYFKSYDAAALRNQLQQAYYALYHKPTHHIK